MDRYGIRGEYLEKMNLCRMNLGLIFVDDLYTLTGKLMEKGDREWKQSASTLRWPKTEIPETWLEQWDEMTADIFPARRENLVWRYRKGIASRSADGTIVRYNGKYYRREETRSRVYSETSVQESAPTLMCEVREKGDGTLEVRGDLQPEKGVERIERKGPRVQLTDGGGYRC